MIRELRIDRQMRVAGIGVSGQRCGVTLIDRRGEVIRPAIIWMDSRSEPQSERLRACCLEDVLAQNGKIPAAYNADPLEGERMCEEIVLRLSPRVLEAIAD